MMLGSQFQLPEIIFRKERYRPIRIFLLKIGADIIPDPPLWKYPRKLWFLRKKGLLKEYFETLNHLNGTSNISAIQNFYYLHVLKKFLPKQPLRVLEIGAGGGIFAQMLCKEFNIPRYAVIDLSEMRQFHDFEFYSPNETPEGKFDLIINFNSLCEMDEDERNRYFDLIYKKLVKGGIFYDVNYACKEVGSNPLRFPYRGTPILWEYCPLQNVAKGMLGTFPRLSLMRIEKNELPR